MRAKVITRPDAEPITVDEARAHLEAPRYGDSEIDPVDDAKIEGWIPTAREHCEAFTGLSLAVRVLEIALDEFPTAGAAIELPMGPVIDIVKVSWGDGSDDEMDADEYTLDDYSVPHCIKPVGTAWPVVTASTNVVKVRYLAGYGDTSDGADPLPEVFRSAMLLLVGHLYEQRSETTEKAMQSLPLGVVSLLRPHRIRLGMA